MSWMLRGQVNNNLLMNTYLEYGKYIKALNQQITLITIWRSLFKKVS